MDTGEVKCIDDEIPFEIPATWEWVRIHSIGVSQLGKTLDRGKDEGQEYPYLCSINVYWDKIDLTKIKYFKLRHEELQRYKLQKGDLLVCEGGDYGRCFVWDREEEMYYQNALHRIRFYCGLSPFFFKYIFELYRNIGYIVGQGQTIKHFTYESMKSIVFPLPPIDEQQRIVLKVAEALPSVQKYNNSQNLLNNLNNTIAHRLQKSILQEAIQGRLVPQIPEEGTAQELLEQIRQEKIQLVKEGKLKKTALQDSVIFKGEDNRYYEQVGSTITDITEEIPFELPKSWMWSRLGIIAELHIGKTPPRGEPRYWSDGTYNWVAISDMVEGGFISKTKEKITEIAVNEIFKRETCPSGSLLMSFKLTVGKTSILETDAYHNEAIITISPFRDDNYILRNYLFHILPLISNYGDSKDAIKGKTLNSKSLNDLLIPLPPLAEQARILEKLEVVYHKVSK